jgi:hypothetical protein
VLPRSFDLQESPVIYLKSRAKSHQMLVAAKRSFTVLRITRKRDDTRLGLYDLLSRIIVLAKPRNSTGSWHQLREGSLALNQIRTLVQIVLLKILLFQPRVCYSFAILLNFNVIRKPLLVSVFKNIRY